MSLLESTGAAEEAAAAAAVGKGPGAKDRAADAAAAAAPADDAAAAAAADAADDDDEPGAAAAPAKAECEVCRSQPHKYRCPGCGVRTCCLACVDGHKAATGCSGKRDRLAFVPMSEFGDRELLSGERGGLIFFLLLRACLRVLCVKAKEFFQLGQRKCTPVGSSRHIYTPPPRLAPASPQKQTQRHPNKQNTTTFKKIKQTTGGSRRSRAPTTSPSATAPPPPARSCRRPSPRWCPRRARGASG